MAATLQQQRNDPAANLHVNLYPRTLMDDVDFRDNRYPSLSKPNLHPPLQSDQLWDRYSNSDPQSFQRSFEPSGWVAEQSNQAESQYRQTPSRQGARSPGLLSTQSQSQSQEPQRTTLSYALPSGGSRRVVERYSLDDNGQRPASRASTETRPTLIESNQGIGRSRTNTPQPIRLNGSQPQDRPPSILPATPRHPAAPSSAPSPSTPGGGQFPAIMPLSASPAYNPPVAAKHRTYPQQPTYVTPPNAPNPINPVYSPSPQPQEEICVECAMRDQDMADVDVTSPGVWERASDVLFEELMERELQDEVNGVIVVDDSSRPKARGGRLTEQNLKIWLSINPREPASRQQTLNTYIKSQRTLLEAEALAHARAMQEAKQLDNRMRDAYSQLRRSAYDMGTTSSPADDMGGVRIKPPQSPSSPANHVHTRSQSREITLLENGMIVEHVDVRREEREARERRRKEEKRARKSSRSSVMDVTSIISAQSNGPLTDNGLKPYSRYSHSSSARPTSVLTAPPERPDLPRAYSQASFSDVHSLGSGSPRRTRFFGMRNLSAGWMSQDSLAPSGLSGSMVDMHVALQREAQGPSRLTTSPIDLRTSRHSQIWPLAQQEMGDASQTAFDEKSKKKKKGFAKIWRIVTGSTKTEADRELRKNEKLEDDFPLAPPPPLSYLVDRGPSELLQPNHRHASTPSIPSITSPKLGLSSPGMSPPTAPSSVLPSPTSSRPPGPDVDMIEVRTSVPNYLDDQDHRQNHEDAIGKTQAKFIYPGISEPDLRLQNPTPLAPIVPNRLSREKSLPPLPPGETSVRQLISPDSRPQTVHTYNPRSLPPGSGPAHDFLPPQAPFCNADTRRQSFGGMASQPNLRLQTMPASKPVEFDGRRSLGPRYDEFGLSRRSLGRLEHVQEHPTRSSSPVPSTKRKSKFGFVSFLGKKQPHQKQESIQDDSRLQFPSMRQFDHEGQDDPAINGYATSTSRHSALSTGVSNNSNLRMSITSRKALEELVAQDPDFVAYRYPSNDQRLDLLR